MTSLISLLVVILVTTGVSNPLSHSDGDSSIDDAIANLTAAINQLLTQSSHSCPVSCRSDSHDSLTDLMQLVLTRQLLTASTPDTCVVDKELKSLVKKIKTIVESQSKQIKKISSQLYHLNRALHNTTGTLADEGEDPSSPLLHSCEEIKSKWPSSPSDYYIIADSHGHARHVYCYMEELCGSTGGWMRVAYLNMTDSSEKCPDGFRQYSENSIQVCGRTITGGGSCSGITFSSGSIEYSQVCGKVIGYQYYSPDGTNNNNINGAYIDGISLTHGSPRKHIWSFISGKFENHHSSSCPCGTVGQESAPSFIGTDYYCESGNPYSNYQSKLYTNDPLWDGQGCGSNEKPCCTRPHIPWFHKLLGYSTTDSIEMRLCCDEGTSNEDVPFDLVEIYVK